MQRGTSRRGLVLAFACITPLGPAAAQLCPQARTQIDLDRCAGDAFKSADAAMNAASASIMLRLKSDDAGRKAFLDAQTAWVGFRKAECAFVASGVAGGSVQPMIAALCAANLTTARVASLRGYLTCQEGDMSCPVPRR